MYIPIADNNSPQILFFVVSKGRKQKRLKLCSWFLWRIPPSHAKVFHRHFFDEKMQVSCILLFQRRGIEVKSSFVCTCPQIYRLTIYLSRQYSYIYFVMSLLVVDFGSPYSVQLLNNWFSSGSLHTDSVGYVTLVDGQLKKISNFIPSFVNKNNFYCCFHISHGRGGVMLLSTRKRLYAGEFFSSQ